MGECMKPNFPELPSEEEIAKHLESISGDLCAVTVCQLCGFKNYMHRLGCKCGGDVKWLWQDRSGSIVECGTDFSPWPNL